MKFKLNNKKILWEKCILGWTGTQYTSCLWTGDGWDLTA